MHSIRIYVLGHFLHIGKKVCLIIHPAHMKTILLSMRAMPVFEIDMFVSWIIVM